MSGARAISSPVPRAIRRGAGAAAAALLVALANASFAPASPAPAWPDGPPVVLHPAVADTVDAAEAARFRILPDVDGLRWAVFLRAPWGGHVARFAATGPDGPQLRERNVPEETWRAWRAQVEAVLAGGGPDRVVGPSDTPSFLQASDSTAVWPEVPLPAGPPAAVPPAAAPAAPLPNLSDRWYVMLEAGLRRDVSAWRTFFGDMGLLALTTGPMLGRVMPWLRLEAAFGDMPDRLEDLAGDGTVSAYGLAAGLSVRQPLGGRWGLLAGGGYGWSTRILQWGGPFYDPFEAGFVSGEVVEQQDWGFLLRLGVTLQRPSPRPRLWELGVAVQSTPARTWQLLDERGDVLLEAEGRDLWLTVSMRFCHGL